MFALDRDKLDNELRSECFLTSDLTVDDECPSCKQRFYGFYFLNAFFNFFRFKRILFSSSKYFYSIKLTKF